MASNASNRGQMRSHTNRSPPFLVIGLLVVICILGFNYWNLSSRNSGVMRQLTDLQEKYRLVALHKISVEKRNGALDVRVREGDASILKAKQAALKKDQEYRDLQISFSNQLKNKDNELQQTTSQYKQCLEKEKNCTLLAKDTTEKMKNALLRLQENCKAATLEAEKKLEQYKASRDCTQVIMQDRLKFFVVVKQLFGSETSDFLRRQRLDDIQIDENGNILNPEILQVPKQQITQNEIPQAGGQEVNEQQNVDKLNVQPQIQQGLKENKNKQGAASVQLEQPNAQQNAQQQTQVQNGHSQGQMEVLKNTTKNEQPENVVMTATTKKSSPTQPRADAGEYAEKNRIIAPTGATEGDLKKKEPQDEHGGEHKKEEQQIHAPDVLKGNERAPNGEEPDDLEAQKPNGVEQEALQHHMMGTTEEGTRALRVSSKQHVPYGDQQDIDEDQVDYDAYEEEDKREMGVNSPLKFEDHDHIGEAKSFEKPVEGNHVILQDDEEGQPL